jgi:serine/threonine-protein kinase
MLVLETEHPARLELGTVLGNYRLTRKLGEGGVGTVYEGEHVRLGRKMAIKVLHPETASAETIVRFFNEARAVNQIHHPNIVDVEDFVTTDQGDHYLIMELLEGEDLRTVLGREGVMDAQRISAIGAQIASALGAIHRAGILHRDVKPDNIFLIRNPGGGETAKLVDFGIAKFLGEKEGMTRAGMTLGTPEYMAPEQIVTTGKPGPAADIYALGMLMYECLAGAPAFTATRTAAILRGHVSEQVVPPSQRRGEPLPPVLEAAILKSLAKEPKDRFADGDAFAAALRADRAVEVAPSRLARAQRNTRALQLLPALAMVLAAAAIHFWPREDRAQAQAATVAAPTPEEPPRVMVAKPAQIDIALISNPDGAGLYIGDRAVGKAPASVTLPVGTDPVTLVARFADGSEVRQTIVPDRPIPSIAFVKPQSNVAQPTRPTKRTPRKPQPASGDKLESRDGTMDPFK